MFRAAKTAKMLPKRSQAQNFTSANAIVERLIKKVIDR
jgi:hypothetical protein